MREKYKEREKKKERVKKQDSALNKEVRKND